MNNRITAIIAILLLLGAAILTSCSGKAKETEKRKRFLDDVTSKITTQYEGLETSRDTDTLRLTVKKGEKSFDLDLTETYSRCSRDQAKKDSIIEAYLAEALAPLGLSQGTSFAVVKDKILPRVVTEKWLMGLPELKGCPAELCPYTKKLTSGILICYLIDNPDTVEYINGNMLSQWNIDTAALHETALTNLRKKTAGYKPQVMKSPKGKIIIFQKGDGYDSARILIAGELAKGEQNVIAAIPDRDYLLLLTGNDEKLKNAAKSIIKEESAKNPIPISLDLFSVKGDTLNQLQ